MTSRHKRAAAILTVGVLLVFAVLFHQRYFVARPIGAGPAGPPVDRTAFSREWTQRPVRLIGIGDSVTAGFGADSPAHSYFNRLIRNPEDEYPEMRGLCLSQVLPHLEATNMAVSGSTSLDHIAVIDTKLQRHDPEVFGLVVMTTGGNDLIHNYGRTPPKEGAMYGATLEQAKPWIEDFRTRLDGMLDKIEARFPGGCEIFLCNIYDPTDGVGDAPSVSLPRWEDAAVILARYNEVIAQCARARSNVHVVPLRETFLGHGSHCRQFWRSTYAPDDPHYWFFSNIEDPNDRGYDAIRRIFLNSIVAHSTLIPGRKEVPANASE